MLVGINAGFGSPLMPMDFQAITEAKLQIIRTEIPDAFDENIIAQFANRPFYPIFVSRNAQHTVGFTKLAYQTLGQQFGIEYLPADVLTPPAEYLFQLNRTREAIRNEGFTGRILVGSIQNPTEQNLNWLRQVMSSINTPKDVAIAYTRYPAKSWVPLFWQRPDVAHFKSREREFAELQSIAKGREIFCTEFGFHTGYRWKSIFRNRLIDDKIQQYVVWELSMMKQAGIVAACWSQLHDTGDTPAGQLGVIGENWTPKAAFHTLRKRDGITIGGE